MKSLIASVFWGAAVVTLYTYAGYPLWMYIRSRFWPRPWLQASILPSVTVILVVHNCARLLRQKIDQLLSLDYPRDRTEVIVVSDGSTDGTESILKGHPAVKSIILRERCGKAAALNAGMQSAANDILLFVDIRPRIDNASLGLLLRNFADPIVGCAAATVVLRDEGHDQCTKAVGSLYWKFEQWIRRCESLVDSPGGVYGGFYAVRRELVKPLPVATVLDDMVQPLSTIRQGYRSVLDPQAVVYDVWPQSLQGEFNRKVRTLAGNFQLLQLAPWVLSRENRLRFELISHKLLRLLVPLLLIVLFSTSGMLARASFLYALVFAFQVLLYVIAMGVCGNLPFVRRIAGPVRAFCMLNVAVVVGFYRFLFTRGPLWKIWTPTSSFAQATPDDQADPIRDVTVTGFPEQTAGKVV
jgi:cellulose synthase/poly-beta-1,6-N-acetylglucosamine synthase-like glycosyltransferase